MVSIENNVIYSTVPEENFPIENVAKQMFAKFDEWSDRVIMIDGASGKTWTAKEFKSAVSNLANRLTKEFNVVKGDVVCFQCDNCDSEVIAIVAVISVGAVFAGCQVTGPYYELHHTVSRTKASFLVVDKLQLEKALLIAENCDWIKKIFILDDEQSDESRNVYSLNPLRNTSYDDTFIPVSVDQRDACIILFSSGTSGLPKPVPRTHQNILANQNCNRDSFDFLLKTDIVPIPWDLCYSSQMKILMTSLLTGSKLVIFYASTIQVLCSYLHKYKFSKVVLVPSYVIQMVKTDVLSNIDISGLEDVFVTGSILTESMGAEFIKKFNIKYLRQLYGTTEVSTIVMQRKCDNPNSNLRCAGIPAPGCSIKIIDRDTGIALGPLCVGELCVKGPTVMSGFLNMPQENLDTFDHQGYYKTGDAAYYDNDGKIFIVDRYKNILKFEGCAVSCAELEFILLKHVHIKEVCVIGVTDDIYGELPKAFVVTDNRDLVSKDVIDFLGSQLDESKTLYGGVVFLDRLPKNNLGKINRKSLLEISSAVE